MLTKESVTKQKVLDGNKGKTGEIFTTPILLLVFNRPKETRRVLQRLAQIRPSKLYVAADGPRQERPEEAALCDEVRDLINHLNWPCQVTTLYREKNLGCKQGVSQGIDWFFAQESEGIILEDDVLPHPSFFEFCEAMLEKYREDVQVMHISGYTFIEEPSARTRDYLFSRFGTVWGWATWRRAWQCYDVSMQNWETHLKKIRKAFPRSVWEKRLELYRNLADGKIDTWDYQWTFWRLVHDGLSIVPTQNMVENIGFSDTATHTYALPLWKERPVVALNPGKLTYEKKVKRNRAYDKKYLHTIYGISS